MVQRFHVVVVGGGPVGLTAALVLARADIDVTVVEKADFDHQEPRASTLHAATLDLLDDLGIYQPIEALGLKCPVMRYWDRRSGRLVAEFDHAVIKDEVRHPWALQCEQDKLSRVLHSHLSSAPTVRLLTHTRAVACEQSDGHVEVTVEKKGGETERLVSDYAIAADGARSTMRSLLGIPFEGFTYPERFLIISTPHNMQDEGYAYRNYLLDPLEWAALFKISWNGPPGLWRLVTPARSDESEDTLSRKETARGRLARFFPSLRNSEIPFYNWYTVDQRVAARFRAGRVLLAGDAAHLNNPLGAMGLNSGLHDAINLGESLVAVLTGRTEEERLDRYCRQRRHVAVSHVQSASMADKRNMEHRDPQERQQYLDALRASAENFVHAKSYMMKASLVDSLRDAATVA